MSKRPIPRWAGIALLLVIAAVFGSNHVAARAAFDHGTNVTTAVAFRSVGTALVVLALLLLSKTPLKVEKATFGRSVLIGLLIAAQSYCLYVYGKSGDLAGRWAEVGAGVLWALGASVAFATALYLVTRRLGGMDGRLGVVNNAAVLNFEPIAVLGLAWLILDQSVAPLQIVGAFIVVGAIAWMAAGGR